MVPNIVNASASTRAVFIIRQFPVQVVAGYQPIAPYARDAQAFALCERLELPINLAARVRIYTSRPNRGTLQKLLPRRGTKSPDVSQTEQTAVRAV
jgi:hypothetical protein